AAAVGEDDVLRSQPTRTRVERHILPLSLADRGPSAVMDFLAEATNLQDLSHTSLVLSVPGIAEPKFLSQWEQQPYRFTGRCRDHSRCCRFPRHWNNGVDSPARESMKLAG